MFINLKYSGYNRHDEQTAAGRFLILMQPKTDSTKYPNYALECADCGRLSAEHDNKTQLADCPEHGILARFQYRVMLSHASKHVESTNIEASDMLLAAIDAMFTETKAGDFDIHVPGCPACDRHKAESDALGCRYFRLKSNTYPIRAIVRYVRMRQMGHWMMGSARIGTERITLSGSYGSDGLPTSVSDSAYESGVELPQYLYDAWNKGGGWNSAGSEAGMMREWALSRFPRK